MHWARDGDFRVLTCAGGHHHVVVIRRTSGARVVVICDGGTDLAQERHAGTYRTWQEARKVAEDIAWGIGVDDLAFAGDWRSEPATPPQKYRLALFRVPVPVGVTKGVAGDLIALAIAKKVDPNRVMKRWTGPWEW